MNATAKRPSAGSFAASREWVSRSLSNQRRPPESGGSFFRPRRRGFLIEAEEGRCGGGHARGGLYDGEAPCQWWSGCGGDRAVWRGVNCEAGIEEVRAVRHGANGGAEIIHGADGGGIIHGAGGAPGVCESDGVKANAWGTGRHGRSSHCGRRWLPGPGAGRVSCSHSR